MTLIDRYILRQIWVPALLAAVVITLVLVGGAVQKQVTLLIDQLPIAQFTLSDIGRISFYATPSLAGYIIPITFLLGIMLSFGQMAQHNELTALKAAGISLKRLTLPILSAGVALSIVTFVIFDAGQPWAFRQLNRLSVEMLVRLTLDALPTGEMHQYGDWRVYIGSKDPDGTLRNIVILEEQGDGKATAIFAKSARFTKRSGEGYLEMNEGHYLPPAEKGQRRRIDSESIDLRLPGLAMNGFSLTEGANSARQLFTLQAQAERELAERVTGRVQRNLRAYRIALAERLAFPLMCLAVSIVAAPIGARTRRSGRSFTFAAGFLIVSVYFVLRKALEPASIPELWEAIALAQVPNLVLAAAGLALLWRVDRV